MKIILSWFDLFQLDKLIDKTEKDFMESELPTDLVHAESMLEVHKRKRHEIAQLINFTADEGEQIVVRVRQTVSIGDFKIICVRFLLFRKFSQN